MGHGASSTAATAAGRADSPPLECPFIDETTGDNVFKSDRLEFSRKNIPLSMEGTSYRYEAELAYVTQRGYYPDDLDKENQDCCAVLTRFLDTNAAFFGVFDGHGGTGDLCSRYAKLHIPAAFHMALQQKNVTLDEAVQRKDFTRFFRSAYIQANHDLHRSDIDDSLSGTTAVSAVLHGDMLYVANVGDSRAIMAIDDGTGNLVYEPLSHDQTPFRKDERERIKRQGGIVRTIDQVEGYEPVHEDWDVNLGEDLDDVGDPPRVWDGTLEKPGCAFTRSVGDAAGEAVGVIADPEVLVHPLNPNDRLCIIASDGVFEFLTNQSVVDILSHFDSLLEGARAVVSEAYRLWLQYEVRTDDISIVVLRVNEMESISDEPKEAAVVGRVGAQSVAKSVVAHESRPVRRTMAKAKRHLIAENWNEEEVEEYDIEAHVIPKSLQELERLGAMVRANFLFQHLTDAQRHDIFRVMVKLEVPAETAVIREGEEGDNFYVIDSGTFRVTQKKSKLKKSRTQSSDSADDAPGENSGDLEDVEVFRYTEHGQSFGELAIMYGKPRAATVTSCSDGVLWSLSRIAFRRILMKRSTHHNLIKLLRGVPLFKALTIPKLQRLSDMAKEETFEEGATVMDLDISARTNYHIMIIEEGTVELRMTHGDSSQPEPELRSTGSYIWPKHEFPAAGSTTGVSTAAAGFSGGSSGSGDADMAGEADGVGPATRAGPPTPSKGEKSFRLFATAVAKTAVQAVCIGAEELRAVVGVVDAESPAFTRLLSRKESMFSSPDQLDVVGGDFGAMGWQFRRSLGLVGDASFVGEFVGQGEDAVGGGGERTFTVKVFNKAALAGNDKLCQQAMQERRLLSVMPRDLCPDLPTVYMTLRSEAALYMVYRRRLVCDLSAAIALTRGAVGGSGGSSASDAKEEKGTASAGTSAVPASPRSSSLNHDELLRCSLSMVAAVASLHDVGVMHRFVSQEAVFVTWDGEVVLTDMRHAKRMDGHFTYTICGDAMYMSPEMITGVGYDYAVDYWALGVLLYELAHGQNPFGAETVTETQLFKKISAHSTIRTLCDTSLPESFMDLLDQLLQVDPATRLGYQDVAHLQAHSWFNGADWSSAPLSISSEREEAEAAPALRVGCPVFDAPTLRAAVEAELQEAGGEEPPQFENVSGKDDVLPDF